MGLAFVLIAVLLFAEWISAQAWSRELHWIWHYVIFVAIVIVTLNLGQFRSPLEFIYFQF